MTVTKKNLYIFGYGLTLILLFLAWRAGSHWHNAWLNYALNVTALAVLLITLTNLPLLRKIYDKWMVGAHFIGTVFSAVILTILFYGVFSPIGILLRILRKDLLDQKIKRSALSYWNKREQGEKKREEHLRQF